MNSTVLNGMTIDMANKRAYPFEASRFVLQPQLSRMNDSFSQSITFRASRFHFSISIQNIELLIQQRVHTNTHIYKYIVYKVHEASAETHTHTHTNKYPRNINGKKNRKR